jgi:hypothetical protein
MALSFNNLPLANKQIMNHIKKLPLLTVAQFLQRISRDRITKFTFCVLISIIINSDDKILHGVIFQKATIFSDDKLCLTCDLLC